MVRSRDQLRTNLIDIGKRMYERNYVCATDGNISTRVSDTTILITPSGVAKGSMQPSDLALISIDGKQLAGKRRPSSEYKLHLAVYRNRPDVQAVVHAHPPCCTALTLAGIPLDRPAVPEVVLTFGPAIPTAAYATPSTDEVPQSIEPFIQTCDAILLERHGAVTVGSSLDNAYQKLEKLEQYAQTVIYTLQLGKLTPLDQSRIDQLMRIRESHG